MMSGWQIFKKFCSSQIKKSYFWQQPYKKHYRRPAIDSWWWKREGVTVKEKRAEFNYFFTHRYSVSRLRNKVILTVIEGKRNCCYCCCWFSIDKWRTGVQDFLHCECYTSLPLNKCLKKRQKCSFSKEWWGSPLCTLAYCLLLL